MVRCGDLLPRVIELRLNFRKIVARPLHAHTVTRTFFKMNLTQSKGTNYFLHVIATHMHVRTAQTHINDPVARSSECVSVCLCVVCMCV